jgi:hypothetical protein
MKYFVKHDEIFGDSILSSDHKWIPTDPLNVDYLEYVQWLFDGNTPEEWNPEVTQPDMEEGN